MKEEKPIEPVKEEETQSFLNSGLESEIEKRIILKLKKDLGDSLVKLGRLNNRINELEFQLERANFNLETYKEVTQ